ncbi:MAG: pentapeptide repeat-containing protein [Candidatus Eremiobacteraeota bacterium]|nr:pentapeptide repeat-containing protein [Candidatus Eremiobacteraeota bacterium]
MQANKTAADQAVSACRLGENPDVASAGGVFFGPNFDVMRASRFGRSVLMDADSLQAKVTRYAALVCAAGLAFAPRSAFSAPSPHCAAELRAARAHADASRKAKLSGCRLLDVDMTGVSLRGADLRGADLLEATLIGADLSAARLDGANLSSVKMAHARLVKATLRRATFLTTMESVTARQADFSGASGYLIAPDSDFTSAVFRHAHLASDLSNQPMGLLHTIFARATLAGADLSFADLSFADLNSADLRGANLSFANLRGADLSAANLTGADLRATRFAQANIDGAIFGRLNNPATIKALHAARNFDQAIFHR